MAGAAAIQALAQAAENKLIGGSPLSVYEALRNLGTANAPIAFSYDPAFGQGANSYPCVSQRLQMVAFTVPHAYTCTGLGMVTHAVGTNYPGTVYNGVGLWQYAANGDATFLRDSGASNGAMWTAVGAWVRPFTSPIGLVAGVVYLAGFQQQSSGGTDAQIRGIAGSQANIGLGTALFQRSVMVANAGSTQAAVMKTWPAASLAPQANLPLIYLY